VVNTFELGSRAWSANAVKARLQHLRHASLATVSATKFRSKFCLILLFIYEKMRSIAPDLPHQFSIAFNIAFQEEL
jgi:hypothetical protein